MNTPRLSVSLAAPVAFIIVTAVAPVAMAGDSLSDILLEKGIITQEDWQRIQNANRKQEETAEQPPVEDTRATEEMILDIVKKREAEAERQTQDEKPPVKVGWGKKGFSLETGDGLFRTTLQWRFQGRWTYPERSDPRNAVAFNDDAESSFELRRVRVKIGGHGYQPWIRYYFEVDLQPGRDFDDDSASAQSRLIDWRITLAKYPWARLRVGQWKINYNRERVDSSGKQTFVERSIVNRVFTLDRQIGVMLYGRLNPGTLADMNYYAGVWTGGGRGLEKNDDAHMMYMGRLQWNVFGRELTWRQSDTSFHERPTASLSLAGYTTIGRCTRWSSGGCGDLSGMTKPSDAMDGQFRVEGVQVGSAFKYRGFAWQHETHWKRVKDAGLPGRDATTARMPVIDAAGDPVMDRYVDSVTDRGRAAVPAGTTNLFGGYFQAGYFPHYLMPVVPKPLEVAFRYAHVDPDTNNGGDGRQEWTGAVNWFFAGHRNKLTLDTSYLTLEQPAASDFSEQRVRLQWDVSF